MHTMTFASQALCLLPAALGSSSLQQSVPSVTFISDRTVTRASSRTALSAHFARLSLVRTTPVAEAMS